MGVGGVRALPAARAARQEAQRLLVASRSRPPRQPPAPQLQKLLAFAPKLKLPLKRHAEKLVKARDTDGVVAGCLKLLGL